MPTDYQHQIASKVAQDADYTLKGITKNNEHLDFDLWMRENEYTAKVSALILTSDTLGAEKYLDDLRAIYAAQEAERMGKLVQEIA